MNCKRENICRLCLKIVDDNFQVIEKATKEILAVLHLKIDLNKSKEPGLCMDCTKNLYDAFSFKSACIYIEDCILPYVNSQNNIGLDIHEIFIKVNKYEGIKMEEGQKVCRFCMKLKEDGCFTSWDSVTENAIQINDLIVTYFPELNLRSVKDPVVCSICLNSLQDCSSFRMMCMEGEKKIKNYIDKNGTNSEGQVNLENVVQFILKNVNKAEYDDKMVINFCKIEVTIGQTKLTNEDVMEIDHLQPKVCKEEIDMKSEETDERFQDNIILSQSKGSSMAIDTHASEIIHDSGTGSHQEHKNSLQTHMIVHKSNLDVPIYQCELCTMQTQYKKSLQKHMLIHKSPSEIPIYKCELCAYQTRHKRNIQRHTLVHRSKSEIPTYKCDICGHQSKYKSSFQKHMLLHKSTSEVPIYKCALCDYQTKFKHNLHPHTLLHKSTLEVPLYKCELCEYESRHKRNLQQHMLLHKSTSEIPLYKCEMCDYQAKRKGNLQEHRLRHKSISEVQLHKCEFCEYQTKRKRNLQKHLSRHKVSV